MPRKNTTVRQNTACIRFKSVENANRARKWFELLQKSGILPVHVTIGGRKAEVQICGQGGLVGKKKTPTRKPKAEKLATVHPIVAPDSRKSRG